MLTESVVNGFVLAQARDRRRHRAIGVYDGYRLGRIAQAFCDAVARIRHRTVAVELIAKKICNEQNARPELAENEPARGLIALDHGAFAPDRAEQAFVHNKLCRYPRHEVCARAVCAHASAGVLQGALNDARRGSFAVCPRNGDYIDIFCCVPEDIGAYLQCQRSGERGCAEIKQPQQAVRGLTDHARKKYHEIFQLFDSHRLCKISGLINIAAAQQRNIVRKKLKRHNAQRRLKYRVCLGN